MKKQIVVTGCSVGACMDTHGYSCTAAEAVVARRLCNLLPGLSSNYTEPEVSRALAAVFGVDFAKLATAPQGPDASK